MLYGVAGELSLGVGLGATVTFGVGVGLMPVLVENSAISLDLVIV